MEEHLEAVANRALIVAQPSKNRELRAVLAIYAEAIKPAQNGRKRAKH